MIKRLRRKFILINLLLVGLVLAVVFILFVGVNVRRLAGQSDAALRLALSWQEGEGPPRFEIGGPPPEEREPDGAHRFSLIPVFVVTVKDGAITGLNDGGQVDVSEETAAEAVEQAQSSGASQGVLRELRLRFLVERRPSPPAPGWACSGSCAGACWWSAGPTASSASPLPIWAGRLPPCAICPCCPCWCGPWPWWVSFS